MSNGRDTQSAVGRARGDGADRTEARLSRLFLAAREAELAAVASRSRESAAGGRRAGGPDVAAYGDYDSLIADDAVECRLHPLPNNLHLGWAVEAMNNGKHVLCEKPLALNADAGAGDGGNRRGQRRHPIRSLHVPLPPVAEGGRGLVRGGAMGTISLVRASYSFVQTDLDDYRRDPGMGGGALLGCRLLLRPHRAARIRAGAAGRDGEVQCTTRQTGVDTTTTALLEFDGRRHGR